MQTEHEADRTTSIMMSRALVQACELTGDMLQRLVVLMDGLQVFPARMRENLDLTGGLIMAEALMLLELGKQIGRQRAHDAVYEAAQASVTQARPFRETLAEIPHVRAGLTAAQIEALLGSRPVHRALCPVRRARRRAGPRGGRRPRRRASARLVRWGAPGAPHAPRRSSRPGGPGALVDTPTGSGRPCTHSPQQQGGAASQEQDADEAREGPLGEPGVDAAAEIERGGGHRHGGEHVDQRLRRRRPITA